MKSILKNQAIPICWETRTLAFSLRRLDGQQFPLGGVDHLPGHLAKAREGFVAWMRVQSLFFLARGVPNP